MSFLGDNRHFVDFLNIFPLNYGYLQKSLEINFCCHSELAFAPSLREARCVCDDGHIEVHQEDKLCNAKN